MLRWSRPRGQGRRHGRCPAIRARLAAKPTGSHAAARSPMRRIVIFLLGVLVGGGLMAAVPSGKAHDDLTGALAAPENHPLLVHMTTADSWRGAMGLEFAQAMMKIGHPVAVFLNLDAVKLALRTGEQEKKSSMQQIPRELVDRPGPRRRRRADLPALPRGIRAAARRRRAGRAARPSRLSGEFRLRRQCPHIDVVGLRYRIVLGSAASTALHRPEGASKPRCDDLGFDNARKIQFLEETEKHDNVIGGDP